MAIKAVHTERKVKPVGTGRGACGAFASALVLAGTLAAGASAQDTGGAVPDTSQAAAREGSSGSAASAAIGEINENPSQYAGQTVTLRGDLKEVVSPTAIRIGKSGFLGIGGEEILVVGTGAFPPGVSERDKDLTLEVTGPIRLFNRVEMERDLLIDLDDELFTVYEGKPVLVAQRIAQVPQSQGGDRLGAAGDQEGVGMAPEGGTAGGAGETASDTAATRELSQLVENTSRFYGDTVDVTGYVARIVDSSSFSLSPTPGVGGDGILVVGKTGSLRNLVAGQEVTVQGLVRRFDRGQYERELGIDLDDALFGAWDKDPSIRAFAIEPMDAATASGPREPGRGGSGEAAGDTSQAGSPTEKGGKAKDKQHDKSGKTQKDKAR